MRLIRTSLPAIAATAAAAALVTGVVVSTVEARHHKSPKLSVPPAPKADTQVEQALAQRLSTMQLPKGLKHTTVCPNTLTATDACFAGTLGAPVASEADALDAATTALRSLDVVSLGIVTCHVVLGGPQGTGYNCAGTGTWHSATLATTVFVSNPGHHPAGVPDIDLMLSVVSARP